MSSKFCSNCGKQVPEDAIFCPFCGTNLKVLEKTPARTQEFSVKEVILSQMLANARVTPTKNGRVVVSIDGDEETKSQAHMESSGGSLKISAPLPFSANASRNVGGFFGGGNVVISSSGGASMINGQLFIDGRPVDMTRIINVNVEVPIGTTIKVGKLIGKVLIGNTEGDLFLNIQGTTDVKAGRVKNLSISISGSGDAEIAEADGAVEAIVSGSGDVSISDGKATSFNASVSGSGSIAFNGVAQTANLGVSGSGSIHLDECLSESIKRKSGSGKIRVTREPKKTEGFTNW